MFLDLFLYFYFQNQILIIEFWQNCVWKILENNLRAKCELLADFGRVEILVDLLVGNSQNQCYDSLLKKLDHFTNVE